MITDDELRQIMPKCPAAKRAEYLPYLNEALEEFEINSYLRTAAFIAQLAHESLELSIMEERGSVAMYERYEGRKSLGNTEPGDGKRFKGRGPFFLTGRANYLKFSELLKLDLIKNPEIAASKEVAFRTAGLIWQLQGLNELADQQRFKEIIKRLGGGTQGEASRLMYYERARKVLRHGDSADVGKVTVAEPSPAAPPTKAKRPATKEAPTREAQKTEQPHREFRFSAFTLEVLDRASALAERSRRGGINSSCLLFAIADREAPQIYTERFVFELLERDGGYDEALQRFLNDSSGDLSRQGAIEVPVLSWKVSRNVGSVLNHAASIAERVGTAEIFPRHLFAALLVAPAIDDQPVARSRLTAKGLDLKKICLEFREHLRSKSDGEQSEEWDAILGTAKRPTSDVEPSIPGDPTASIDSSMPEAIAHPLTDSVVADAYQRSYSSFIPDRASYGRPKANEPLDDSLGVGVYAGHFAQLIAAKDTFMPLSIGLFGAWGSGKSHFIDLLDEQLRALTKDPGKVFHEQIVQVRFNAWHYLDTNLWANLVSEIFDQLFAKLNDRTDTTPAQVELLKKRLAEHSALAAEAKVALGTAENARQQAEDKLRKAVQQRAQEQTKVSNILNDLKNLLLNDPDTEKQLEAIAGGLGLPRVATSFAELEARAQEVRSLGGRTKALLLALFSGRGWWKRVMLLALVLAVPLGVAWLAGHGPQWMQELLAGAGRTIAQVMTVIVAFSTWLGTQAKAGNALVNNLESAYDHVKEVRAQREANDPIAVAAQKALAIKKQAEEEARHTLFAVEEKMKTIRAELAEMAPGRQLIRFLKDRATADDYKQHLGLVSLVRRDFEQLSKLLIDARDAKEEEKPKEPLESNDPNDAKEEEKVELPKIDRIVLYIDDLDRCRADRVIEVLEAVHLLLAFELFAVVVAVDPRWLRQSLLDHYPRLLGGMEDDGVNLRRRILGRPATPQDYLEKIFQVPFNLQAMEKTGFETFVKRLFPFEETPPPLDHQPTDEVDTIKDEPLTTPPPLKGNEATDPTTPPTDLSTEPKTPAAERPVLEEKISKPPPPPDPKRLKLTKREAEDVERFQVLFETPRAVKRMANTYSLIRVGVDKDEWDEYLGSKAAPGTYRIPLLLLAVTSAFPSLARPWLIWLSETAPSQWQLEPQDVDTLAEKHKDATDRADWDRLALSLKQVNVDTWRKPEPDTLRKWAARVGRYSF